MSTSFGIFLTNQHPLGTDQIRALDEQIAMLHACRDNSWDMVWVGQHFLPDAVTHIQPVPYVARLAPEAGDMQLGVGINLLALANPVEVAETYAALDVVTRGRLIYGAGLGYRDVEYNAFAIPKSGQVHRLEENLRIVCALWNGDAVDADLPWCRLNQARLSLLPVQRPRPAIWMAANSDRAVERSARLADTWFINPHATTDVVVRQIKLFNATAATHARPNVSVLPLMREVFCAPTRAQAVELAAPYLRGKYRTYASWGQDKVMPDRDDFTAAYHALAQDRFIVGTPEDCIEQLLPWKALGVNAFVIRTHWSGMPVASSLASLALLSREVLPTVRSAP